MIKRALNDERGTTIVLVAILLTGLLSVLALAIDIGMVLDAKTEAQRAADSGALAGAGKLLVDPTDATQARATAIQFANDHVVRGDSVDVLPGDVDVDLANLRVTVRVRNVAARANAVTTFFARIFGIDTVDIGADAVAQVEATNTANCLKPWILADAWKDNNGNDKFDGPDFYQAGLTSWGTSYRNPGHPGDDGLGYVNDYGRQIILKPGNGGNWQPGWYNAWDLPGSVGGNDYRHNIETCNPAPITIGEEYPKENGNMVGPTRQGTQALIDQDPSAVWNPGTKTVDNSAFPSWESSPRRVYMPLFDPTVDSPNGKKPVRITGIVGFWIESVDKNSNVTGRFLTAGGVPSGGPVDPDGSLKFVRLVQ